jgi:hypothetical protein
VGLRPSGSFDCAQDDGFVVLWAKDKQRQGVRGAAKVEALAAVGVERLLELLSG